MERKTGKVAAFSKRKTQAIIYFNKHEEVATEHERGRLPPAVTWLAEHGRHLQSEHFPEGHFV
jgi:hypothetical protein